jgi:hypothetical protein
VRRLPVFGSDCKSRSFARKVTRKGARENGESITRNREVVRRTIEAVTKPGLLDWIVDALHLGKGIASEYPPYLLRRDSPAPSSFGARFRHLLPLQLNHVS